MYVIIRDNGRLVEMCTCGANPKKRRRWIYRQQANRHRAHRIKIRCVVSFILWTLYDAKSTHDVYYCKAKIVNEMNESNENNVGERKIKC